MRVVTCGQLGGQLLNASSRGHAVPVTEVTEVQQNAVNNSGSTVEGHCGKDNVLHQVRIASAVQVAKESS